MVTASAEDETKTEPLLPSVANDGADSEHDIRYVIFESKHVFRVLVLTLLEFPFPENVLGFLGNLFYCSMYGVIALDAEDNVAGYFLGGPSAKVGLSRKKVAHLVIVCVSSKHQKRGIAKRMGRFMMGGEHPKFSPDDYDEILLMDTDAWNSPSWLFSDRNGFRYCPTHDLIRRFGVVGYLQIILTGFHILPCQFMKRYAKTDDEVDEAESYETQKGVLACFVSGILPPVFWVMHWIRKCGDQGSTIRGTFVGMVFGVVYFMLVARFSLAHLMTTCFDRSNSIPKVVFREYDTWWSPMSFAWPASILGGVPLLGWTGGFYLGSPGVNYLKEEHRRALGLVYLPINLFTLAIFLMHTLLRIFAPTALLFGTGLLDVLGYAAFFCSITDLAMPIVSFPSGAMAIRLWKFWLFALLWMCWLALLLVSILLPPSGGGETSRFLDLSDAACAAA